jgi:hypothetical protein
LSVSLALVSRYFWMNSSLNDGNLVSKSILTRWLYHHD